jgi:hypothetical protein
VAYQISSPSRSRQLIHIVCGTSTPASFPASRR